MTFPALGSFVLGAVVNIALLSYGARRLLAERRFSLSRTVVAGLAGSALAMATLVTWRRSSRPGRCR